MKRNQASPLKNRNKCDKISSKYDSVSKLPYVLGEAAGREHAPFKGEMPVLFPDVTCVVPDSLAKNVNYGIYDLVEADLVIVLTLLREENAIHENGRIVRKDLDVEQIMSFVQGRREAFLAGEVLSNHCQDGYYYHMTSNKEAKPFIAFTLVVREGSPFSEKDLRWLDIYGDLNFRRVLIENTATQEHNLRESIFGSVTMGILGFNLSRKMIMANPVAVQIFSLPAAVERAQLPFCDTEEETIFWTMVDRAASENEKQINDEFIYTKGGQSRVFRLMVSPLVNSKGEVAGTVVAVTDRTEQSLLAIEVEQLKRYAMLGEISAGLAHDIKNPLMIIRGCAKQIVSDRADLTSLENIRNIIDDQAARINKAVDQLMAYDVVTHELAEDTDSSDINEVLRSCIRMVNLQRRMREIHIQMYLDEKVPPVAAKAGHLKIIFSNILLNAIQAIESSGTITVITELDARTDCLTVLVKDDGCGMTPEQYTKLFTPFYTKKSDGSGMGLFIAKRILLQYHAEISFMPNEGRGTCCRIDFRGLARRNGL